MNANMHIVNALSFDIEDWFHLVEVPAVEDPATWPKLPTLVERYTGTILETLAAHDTKATFFMLGWIADRYPLLARRIADAGHEVGIHSYWHRRCDKLTPAELRDDLRRNKDLVEQQTGRRVQGFRAPSFSITPGAEWVFDVLLDLGLEYDSSLFPAPRGQGGYPCQQAPHRFIAPSGRSMPELPISTLRYGPLKLAFSGGGYLRLLPEWLIRHGFAKTHQQALPVVVYLHPRDFAADCPRMPMQPHRRFKSYVGLHTTQRKLDMLLRTYRFDTCAAVLGLEESTACQRRRINRANETARAA
jgi:polysaccharide deacetylase family protein (PEP-CTERM system associated)